jgi:hypothetical protein
MEVNRMNFQTVEEETFWSSFEYKGQVYDLSHLKAHHAEYNDYRDSKKIRTYKYIVTYGFHCFTKECSDLSEEESNLLLYKTKKEKTRHFNFERYQLSKHLPKIILSLGDTSCFHSGHGSFFRYEISDDIGNTINYKIVFKSFREKKKLRLHIETAFPVEEERGMKKINFFIIAYNTLYGKPTKEPRA